MVPRHERASVINQSISPATLLMNNPCEPATVVGPSGCRLPGEPLGTSESRVLDAHCNSQVRKVSEIQAGNTYIRGQNAY